MTDGLSDLPTAGMAAIGLLLAMLWAALYYPMALLVAGYTNSFTSTINPIVGLATVGRLGLDYVKAYFMCLFVFGLQIAFVLMVSMLGPVADDVLSNKMLAGVAYFVEYVLRGAVVFIGSMITAALLGLLLFKRPDVVAVDDL
jgi:hypothetical protein